MCIHNDKKKKNKFSIQMAETFKSMSLSMIECADYDPRVAAPNAPPPSNPQLLSKICPKLCNCRDVDWCCIPTKEFLDTAIDSETPGVAMMNMIKNTVYIYKSKEAPKRIEIRDDRGHHHSFVLKRERKGDLRKDERMMEVGGVLNQLLASEPETRRRNLQMVTYKVTPLFEDAGLIEYIENLIGVREAVHSYWSVELPFNPYHAQYWLDAGKQRRGLTREDKCAEFVHRVLPCFPAVLHRWYLSRWGAQPSCWLEAREAFTRSISVWSLVGWVVGLGDRHGDNILINCKTGCVVHVDFDCIFQKGLKLAQPEVVPFRLTQNLIAPMGAAGVVGAFRICANLTMSAMRETRNRNVILAVLQSYIDDPSIEWLRTSRSNGPKSSVNVNALREAKCHLLTIDKKLTGLVNYSAQPYRIPQLEGKKEQIEFIEAGKERGHGLSVEAQVSELVEAARCPWNLSSMYVGWQPWM
eukprot:GHVL01044971.1.p2 GENE.GHVL01044971.1~~GHVL01044971.1.p2  ORF type:complete len:469 (-),score=92.18 GHVL01044971.1:1629-3035(-)